MFFDDYPVKKLHNFFLTIGMFRILDEKDVLFEIFQISSDFEVIDHLVHFLYRKIFSKRGFE
jgi:hypothetical protein